jgi:hypothetical protein
MHEIIHGVNDYQSRREFDGQSPWSFCGSFTQRMIIMHDVNSPAVRPAWPVDHSWRA